MHFLVPWNNFVWAQFRYVGITTNIFRLSMKTSIVKFWYWRMKLHLHTNGISKWTDIYWPLWPCYKVPSSEIQEICIFTECSAATAFHEKITKMSFLWVCILFHQMQYLSQKVCHFMGNLCHIWLFPQSNWS